RSAIHPRGHPGPRRRRDAADPGRSALYGAPGGARARSREPVRRGGVARRADRARHADLRELLDLGHGPAAYPLRDGPGDPGGPRDPEGALSYPKLLRGLRDATTRRKESSASLADMSARHGVQMMVRSSTAIPSGTIAADTRGRAPGLLVSGVGTSQVGNGRSSPPAGAGLATGEGDPARPIVSTRQ